MKRERRITVLSIGVNSLVTFVKIYAGLIFNSYTLMVSGYNTLCDTTLDFMAYSGSVFRGRRANRKEPFGYGRCQNYATIFVGIVIVLLGVFIVFKSFFLNYVVTDLKVLLVLFVVAIIMLVYGNFLFRNAKEIQSTMLMDMAHISFYDGAITAGNIFFIFLSSIIPVFDLLGCLFMGAVLMYKGIGIIINNFILLNCQNDQNKTVIKKIERIIKDGEGISYSNCNLINVKKYYKVVIEILVDDDVSLNDLILWEEYLRGNIKASKISVKFVEFLVYKK